jgi:GNAT superfamily N-acetyltransferase
VIPTATSSVAPSPSSMTGLMVGYGLLAARAAAAPVHEMQYQDGVHPAYRGRGVSRQLLAWAEAAAVPLHRQRYPGRSLSLSGKCPAGNAGAVALYAERGYRRVRCFHGMTRDLSAPLSDAPAPAGVEIVGFTPDRSEHARLIRNEAFRDHWGSTEITADSWAQFMVISAFRPAFSFPAYAGGEPVELWGAMGSYGDLNPRPLACHQQAAHPQQYIRAGQRLRACVPVLPDPGRLRYFPAVLPRAPGRSPGTLRYLRPPDSHPRQLRS